MVAYKLYIGFMKYILENIFGWDTHTHTVIWLKYHIMIYVIRLKTTEISTESQEYRIDSIYF